jgi:PPOX class probable F420-dependent enzyme
MSVLKGFGQPSAHESGGGGAASPLAAFARRRTTLLTTYKRDGTPVGTPVTIAVAGDRAFIRSYDRAGKTKRMRNRPDVRIAPSTVRGKVVGPEIGARSRLLSGKEAAEAARAVARRQPVLQGIAVPLSHRLMRYRTLHYEITPAADG